MSVKIPQVNNKDKDFQLFQTQQGKVLQPLLSNPINFGVSLTSVTLVTGSNTIPHKLNRTLQGWFMTRQRAQATVWDEQDTNPNKNSTLILNTTANVVVDLWVF